MEEKDGLAERFERHRGPLRALAYRMLGSLSEADDAVQEAWLRFSRADTGVCPNSAGKRTGALGGASAAGTGVAEPAAPVAHPAEQLGRRYHLEIRADRPQRHGRPVQ